MTKNINVRDSFEWPVIVSNSNPHANMDYYYGPYDSYAKMADPKEGVPSTVYFPGFTAAVLNEDGSVTEYQLEVKEGCDYKDANDNVIVDNLQWVMKGVPKKDYITFKGTAESKDELPTGAAVGDMYIISNKDQDNNYSEYVWTGEKWELLGTATTEMKGALSVTGGGKMLLDSGATTTYNGTQDVKLDLSDLAKATDLSKYQTKGDYATKTELNNAISSIPSVDLSGCATKDELESCVTSIESLQSEIEKLTHALNCIKNFMPGVLRINHQGSDLTTGHFGKRGIQIYGAPKVASEDGSFAIYCFDTNLSINGDAGYYHAKGFYEES